jgi:NitT/TauT family transport system substrate-binding protein
MRRPFLAILTTVLLLGGAVACGGDSEGDSGGAGSGQAGTPDKVNVGVIPILDVAPIYLGKEKGFFTDRNIDLTLTAAQGGAAIVPAVLSGEFQFGFSNMVSLLLAQAQNVPVKVVANGVASTGVDGKDFCGIVVQDDSPIKTAADLAGKSVAINTLKNIAETSTRASIRKAGGDPTAVKLVEIGFPDMPAALSAGRVDAIFAVEPTLSTALSQGGRMIASSYVDTAPNLTVAAYFTAQKTLAENPDLVRRFTEAMAESLSYADAHPDEARAIIASYTKIPPEVIAKLTLPKWPPEVNRQSVQTLADLAVGDGLLTKTPDLNALLPAS